jgi:hypothetical protein
MSFHSIYPPSIMLVGDLCDRNPWELGRTEVGFRAG